jgi:putative CocE/NonD family hydrolase
VLLVGVALAPSLAPRAASAEPVTQTEFLSIPLADGTPVRACTVALPGRAERRPVVLEWTSYAIDADFGGGQPAGCPPQFKELSQAAARAGYVYVAANTRGTGASGGGASDLWGSSDGRDGAAVVEWLATRPWSTGKVGLVGCSNSGALANLVAAERPPHLAALATSCAPLDVYRDVFYPGGLRSYAMAFLTARGMHELGPQMTSEMLARGDFDFVTRPLANAQVAAGLFTQRTDGPFWRDKSVGPRLPFAVPTLYAGSWSDYMLRGTTEYAALHLKPTDRVLLHPGPHGVGSTVQGRYGFDERALQWFDHHLRGRPLAYVAERQVLYWELLGGASPPVDQLTGRWRESPTWPPPTTRYQRWYLHDTPSGTSSALDEGTLSPNALPDSAPAASYTYPVLSPGTASDLRQGGAAPLEAELGDRGGAVTWTSAPMKAALRLAGPITLTLHASTTAVDTDFVVRLLDVAPDGTTTDITNGWLKAAHRALDPTRTLTVAGQVVRPWHPHVDPQPVTPGQVERYDVEVLPTAVEIAAGHRLRLFLSAQEPPWFLQEIPPSVTSVHQDALRPSSVLLPVVAAQAGPARSVPRPVARPVTAPAPAPAGGAALPATGSPAWPAAAALLLLAVAAARLRRSSPG